MARGSRTKSKAVVIFSVALAIVALSATFVLANHDFSDVPASAFYHDEVSYIVDRNITAGCGGGKYCPNADVTRGQMAVFLQKTSAVSSPTFITDTEGAGAVDLDAAETMCVTGSYTPTYPQVARFDSWASLEAAGTLNYVLRNQYSTNGGVSWTNLDGAAVARSGGGTGDWVHINNSAILNLTSGTTYTFSVEVARQSGTADATDSRCEIIVQIDNRNA